MLYELHKYLEWNFNEKVKQYHQNVIPCHLPGEPPPNFNQRKGKEIKDAIEEPLLLLSNKEFCASLAYPCSSEGDKRDKEQEYNAGKRAELKAFENKV